MVESNFRGEKGRKKINNGENFYFHFIYFMEFESQNGGYSLVLGALNGKIIWFSYILTIEETRRAEF